MIQYDGTKFNIPEDVMVDLKRIYGRDIDVEHQFEMMRLWLQAHPRKRYKNYYRFALNWLNRAYERAVNLNRLKQTKTWTKCVVCNQPVRKSTSCFCVECGNIYDKLPVCITIGSSKYRKEELSMGLLESIIIKHKHQESRQHNQIYRYFKCPECGKVFCLRGQEALTAKLNSEKGIQTVCKECSNGTQAEYNKACESIPASPDR